MSSQLGERGQRDVVAFERVTDARIDQHRELERTLAGVGGCRDELRVGLAGVAHELGDAVLEPRQEREEVFYADVPRMLELTGEVIRRAHSLRTVLVSLLWRVRARGRTRLARELADRPGEGR